MLQMAVLGATAPCAFLEKAQWSNVCSRLNAPLNKGFKCCKKDSGDQGMVRRVAYHGPEVWAVSTFWMNRGDCGWTSLAIQNALYILNMPMPERWRPWPVRQTKRAFGPLVYCSVCLYINSNIFLILTSLYQEVIWSFNPPKLRKKSSFILKTLHYMQLVL